MDGQKLKTGVKKDEGKNRWDLLPYDAVDGIVSVLTFGAKKYDDRNWEQGIKYGRVFAAMHRHLASWWHRDNTDNETGMSHLWHAGCCLLFLITYERRGMNEFDDRPMVDQTSKDGGIRSGEKGPDTSGQPMERRSTAIESRESMDRRVEASLQNFNPTKERHKY